MDDVGSVEPLTLLNESLRPEQLLWWTKPQRHPENLVVDGVLEPLIVDTGDAVARAEDQIHEVLAPVHLAQPVWKRQLGVVPGGLEDVKRPPYVFALQEDIEVLGVAINLRVSRVGERAAHQKRHAGVPEPRQGVDVEIRRSVFDPWS